MLEEVFMLSTKRIALFGFLICLGVVTTGLVLEYWENLAPCLLCHTQRILFIALGIFYFFIFFQKKTKKQILSFMTILFSVFGVLVSGWQVYLQNKPAEDNGICLPSLNFLWQTGSFSDVFNAIIHGTGGECAQVIWRFLGLSMAAWALLVFSGLFFLSLLLFVSNKRTLANT